MGKQILKLFFVLTGFSKWNICIKATEQTLILHNQYFNFNFLGICRYRVLPFQVKKNFPILISSLKTSSGIPKV